MITFIMLTVEPKISTNVEHVVQSLLTLVLFMYVLRSTPTDHTPLNICVRAKFYLTKIEAQ